jgi:glycosyltransferase involved in cell wall biosynthesis
MKRPRQPPIQLYRPDDASLIQEADFLLQRTDLTDEDVLDFLHGKPRRAPAENNNVNETLRHRFHQRREEIRNLKVDLRNGRARIDEDDRLVPLEAQAPGPQQPVLIFQQVNNNEQQEEQWVEQEQRETAEAIVRSVAHYREQGVPEEDFELIIIPPRETTANLTFRRICFAVVAVVSAFVVVILQTLPSSVSPDALDPYFDKLMYELVFVRHFHAHIKHCPGLHRNGSKQWRDQVLQKLGFAPEKYCDDGVLHIPAKHAILDKYLQASTEEDAALLKPFKDGVNVSWTIPCVSRRESAPYQCQATDEGECAVDSATMQQCFRGVHDNILSDEEVVDVLQFGNYLVKQEGSDNLDVFYATYLERQLPEVLNKLKLLLRETYNFIQVEPITFRITSAGPMDGYGVNPDSMALNETVRFQLFVDV